MKQYNRTIKAEDRIKLHNCMLFAMGKTTASPREGAELV